MKTYVINLDSRTDRMEEMRDANVPFEYERFPATHKDLFLDIEKNKNLRGHLGCHDSHLRLLKKIRDDGEEMVLVLEDDAQFLPNSWHALDRIMGELPSDWDLLYLGGNNMGIEKEYSSSLNIAEDILQTHAYVVRKKFLDTLIDTLENWKYKVDIVFSKAIKNGNCYIVKSPIAEQRQSFSNITNR